MFRQPSIANLLLVGACFLGGGCSPSPGGGEETSVLTDATADDRGDAGAGNDAGGDACGTPGSYAPEIVGVWANDYCADPGGINPAGAGFVCTARLTFAADGTLTIAGTRRWVMVASNPDQAGCFDQSVTTGYRWTGVALGGGQHTLTFQSTVAETTGTLERSECTDPTENVARRTDTSNTQDRCYPLGTATVTGNMLSLGSPAIVFNRE